MSKMIQIRNVPDRLHRELVRRAKANGKSLTSYIEEILEREVSTPDWDDVVAQIQAMPPVAPEISSAELIHEARREAGRE